MEKFDLNQNKNQENKEIEKAPEGWGTVQNLMEVLGVSRNTILRFVSVYRATHPEYFKTIRFKAQFPRDYFSPELVSIIKGEIQKASYPPEGWATNNIVSEETNLTHKAIKNIVSKYYESHPEYFKEFKSKTGKVREHFSPELISFIKKEMESKTDNVPDGWKSNSRLVEESKLNTQFIKNIAREYRKNHPEFFKKFSNVQGKKYEYYSPEFINIVLEKGSQIVSAPKGWRTNRSVSVELESDEEFIKKRAEHYRQNYPEYFKKFKTTSGEYEHYSPELIEIISSETKKFKGIPVAPMGWLTVFEVTNEVGIFQKQIKKMIDNYHITHPEYFREFKCKAGPVREHFSPALVEIIKQEVDRNKNLQEHPENWKTKEDLAEQTGLSIEDINKAASKLKKDFPDKFGKFKGKE